MKLIQLLQHTTFQYLGDLIEEYYDREQRISYFLVIDEANLLLNHTSLIEITKQFDKVALISVIADDIKYFAVFKGFIIINLHNDDKYIRNIYVNQLVNSRFLRSIIDLLSDTNKKCILILEIENFNSQLLISDISFKLFDRLIIYI